MANQIKLKELQELRAEIEDSLTDIKIEASWKKQEARDIAIDRGAKGLTIHKLDYIVKQGLVKPDITEGDYRDTHKYGRRQICEIILIQRLRVERSQTLTQISNLLREEGETRIDDTKAANKKTEEPVA
jgi:DNA-binding transcriptional MerR regulator